MKAASTYPPRRSVELRRYHCPDCSLRLGSLSWPSGGWSSSGLENYFFFQRFEIFKLWSRIKMSTKWEQIFLRSRVLPGTSIRCPWKYLLLFLLFFRGVSLYKCSTSNYYWTSLLDLCNFIGRKKPYVWKFRNKKALNSFH